MIRICCAFLIFFITIAALPSSTAFAQDRDVRSERVVLDDNSSDGGMNTMTLQVPAGGLSSNRTLTFPDADGAVAMSSGPLTAGQLLFGGAGGELSQSTNLLWNDGTSILNIGSGNFTVQAGSGNTSVGGTLMVLSTITGGSSITLGEDTSPTAGTIILHDNTSANTFTGTVQVADPLTANRTYTLPDADGTLALVGTIVTDASLTGDGSSGNPLGIDLTNANSWTGAQTFSSVDVNGGTIDGTAIGSSSPSTGAFTTITGGSTVTLGDDSFPTRGRVILHDNLDLNSFQGTLQTASILTGNRTYTLPDADGTLALVGTIVTDASLTGDGSSGNPLGIDLTNANSWTGAQTFSSVDVNGGTIDGTAIGSSSPSTGAFTTITGGSTVTLGDDSFPTRGRVILHDNLDLNSFQGTLQTASILTGNRTYMLPDASGTLVVAGTETVSTNATLTGDGSGSSPLGIDLTNANSWTGAQTFSSVDVNGGTIDGTAIGSSSPSTGAFTTITSGSTVTLGDDLFPTRGRVILHDNLDLNGFVGTLQTDPTLDDNRTYTLPDATGTIALTSDLPTNTDATLTGDGSVGTPFGIDLTNANSWTGAQTFSSVDVNGGTMDGTAIGAASPASGAFTTISGTSNINLGDDATGAAGNVILQDQTPGNTFFGILHTATALTANRNYTLPDADGTIALNGAVAITSDATLTGDGTTGNALGINVGNANSWTGAQTFSSVDVNGGTIDGTTIGATTPAAASVSTFVATGTSDLQGAVSNSTGSVTVDDALVINSGGTTDLRLGEASIGRNSAASETISIDNPGTGDISILVNGASVVANSRIVVSEGHWTSQGTAPAVAGDGTNIEAVPTISAAATDVAGQITATDGGNVGLGVITVTFDAPYESDPIVTVTPGNSLRESPP